MGKNDRATLRPLYTGTMGWAYEDWRGVFYESGLATARMLEQYAAIFPTIELDSTFYGAPRASTLDGWVSVTPPAFLFSAKVPRAITHERRLRGASEAALDFGMLLQEHLGNKLGALLLQLPPDLTTDESDVLRTFLNEITTTRRVSGLPWVVEFRHDSWLATDILEMLTEQGILAATTERLDLGGPLHYVRLLGVENSVARFDARQFDRTEELQTWAARLTEARRSPPPSPLFMYVRNFYEGHAPETLFTLHRLLGLPVPTPPGKQQMSLF